MDVVWLEARIPRSDRPLGGSFAGEEEDVGCLGSPARCVNHERPSGTRDDPRPELVDPRATNR